MTNLKLERIIFPLLRPQYVPSPEVLISAMAWSLYDVKLPTAPAGKKVGLVFRGSPRPARTLEYFQTAPDPSSIHAFANALRAERLRPTTSMDVLAEAVLNSIEGIQVDQGRALPASPLTPSLALLQNVHGSMGTANPPSISGMLELLFLLGMPIKTESIGPAKLWAAAAEQRMEKDSLLRSLDNAVNSSLFISPPKKTSKSKFADRVSDAYAWEGLFPNTPFEWFYKSWSRLTSEEWVDALPARVWVDWATTVLRLAVGCGYLWEASWYETFARKILSAEQFTWCSVQNDIDSVIPWASSRASMSIRDVSSKLSWRVRRADKIRSLLSEWLSQRDTQPLRSTLEFTAGIREMQNDAELKSSLSATLSSRETTSATTNRWEAIKYSLVTRETNGQFVDYYGLLKSHGARGRYLTIDPGTEWIAVVASLACERPKTTTDVSSVLDSLASLGLHPSIGDIVELLEKAGLARNSADADQGVQVQSAF